VVRDCRRRGEVSPAEFYCSLEEGVLERVAPTVFGFPQRRNFLESKLSGVFSGSIRNTQSTSGNRFFAPPVFYSRRAPRGCSALREILHLEEIPDGLHFEKIQV
jgi:hypothetical protein